MTKTNPTTDGLVERLAAWIASPSMDGTENSGMFEVAFALEIRDAITASELLVTKLQNQLDSRGNGSANASLRPTPESADTEAEPSAVWRLDAEQSATFAEALLEPAEPNEALKEAAARYRASHGMTVAELRSLLDGQPDNARVLVFDHFTEDRTTTIGANCVLSMDHNGPVAIICNQDENA